MRKIIALNLFFPCAVLLAQVSSFEGQRIVEIRYSPLQPLDPSDLNRAVPLKVGDPLHADAVAAAIDGLFASGRFEDISLEGESVPGGVSVHFVTKLTWFLGGITVQGKVSTPPNRAQIAAAGQFTLGSPFHDKDVKQAVDSMKQLLQSNGLYEAQVNPEVEQNDTAQQVFITFKLQERKRAKYEMPVIHGQTLLSDATILRATGWRVRLIHLWRQVTDARTRSGVQGILNKYEKQDRLEARVDLDKLDYDAQKRRVQPTLTITPGPRVKVTAVETKVSKRILKRYVPVFEERAVYNDLLVEGKRNLEDYFQSQGYYDVEVDFRMGAPENDLQTIEYVISRGTRYKLVRVAISGNKYFRTEGIRERMFMQPAAFNLRHGRYSEAFQKKDEENIADLYRANGFRDVKVTTVVDRKYQGKEGQVSVTVNITEGPQWLVDHLTLEGIDANQQRELIGRLHSSVGEPFSEAGMAADRSFLLTWFFSRGYPAATCKPAWQPSGAANHVNLSYTLSLGDRQYVRDVVISGLSTTRRSLVEKQIRLQPGAPLSPVEQIDSQKRLYDLQVFARVDTAIENPDGNTAHKYVLYNFDEANRYKLAIGVGAQVGNFGTPSNTSLSSPAGTTGFSPEGSFDLSRLDFLGLGHTITLRGLYSNLQQRASLSYLEPRFRGVTGQDLTFTVLYDHTLNVRTFASRREEASVQMSEKFSKSLTGILRLAYRRVSVSSVEIPVLLVPQFLQPVKIGMISANFAQDRRDNSSNPQRGIYNTADLGLSAHFIGSSRNFGRVLLRNATYHKLWQNVILARQTQFGIIQPFFPPPGLPASQSVPLPERFFGGGADSLRAFGFNQAGPRDVGEPLFPGGPSSAPTGFPLGGNALLFNNVELRFPLIGENIQGVIFHDMGNVFTSVGDISFRFHQQNLQDFNYVVHAPGIGVRYRTPVGPIRVDLAYTINPPSFLGFSGTPAQVLQCNPNLPQSSLPGFCQSTRQTTGHLQFFFSIGQTF